MPYKNKEDERNWYIRNKKRVTQCRIKKETLYPYTKVLSGIISRCSGRCHHYYKKGIKNFINVEGIRQLWFRDKAYLMQKPSVHRINSREHYTMDNCQFIELTQHLALKRGRRDLTHV